MTDVTSDPPAKPTEPEQKRTLPTYLVKSKWNDISGDESESERSESSEDEQPQNK